MSSKKAKRSERSCDGPGLRALLPLGLPLEWRVSEDGSNRRSVTEGGIEGSNCSLNYGGRRVNLEMSLGLIE